MPAYKIEDFASSVICYDFFIENISVPNVVTQSVINNFIKKENNFPLYSSNIGSNFGTL